MSKYLEDIEIIKKLATKRMEINDVLIVQLWDADLYGQQTKVRRENQALETLLKILDKELTIDEEIVNEHNVNEKEDEG